MKVNLSEHDNACMVCGTRLVYDTKAKSQTCFYCREKTDSAIYCPENHFVCDTCHASDALKLLERMADSDTSTDPQTIVDKAMRHHSFKFHGPEHHSLVPAAMLIAMKNNDIMKPDGSPITTDLIKEGIERGSKIPGGLQTAAINYDKIGHFI